MATCSGVRRGSIARVVAGVQSISSATGIQIATPLAPGVTVSQVVLDASRSVSPGKRIAAYMWTLTQTYTKVGFDASLSTRCVAVLSM